MDTSEPNALAATGAETDQSAAGAPTAGDAVLAEKPPASIAVQIDGSDALTYTWADIRASTPGISKAKVSFESENSKSKCCCKKGSHRVSKDIIKGVSGVAYPYEVLAIMGSSGAGKTTLLNVLTGSKFGGLVVSGERYLNDRTATHAYISSVSAYVHQDDMFIGALTVREHLSFVARVRMSGSKTFQRRERVNTVLKELGLDGCADTKIGDPTFGIKGISGGEMRRLSFASEILTDPSVLFCDEPTSGLDSFMSQTIVDLLKALANKGKTVICTIHQPSSQIYTRFDKVLYLAEGRVAYLGPAVSALGFFASIGHVCPENFNPCDFIIELLAIHPEEKEQSHERLSSICDAYDQSEHAEKVKVAVKHTRGYQNGATHEWKARRKCCSGFKTSWCNQFCAVLWRSTVATLKDPMAIWARLISCILTSIMIGAVYWNQKKDQAGIVNMNASIFLMMCFITMVNGFSVSMIMCPELPVFYRDYNEGLYGSDVYILARSLAELPIFLFVPSVFSAISWFMVGYSDELSRFLIFVLAMVLLCNVSVSLGYIISVCCESIILTAIVTPVLNVPFLMFAGFLTVPSAITPALRWITYISWYFWGWEILGVNQWHGVKNIKCPGGPMMPCIVSGDQLLEKYELHKDDVILDIVVLLILAVSFRFIGWAVLAYQAIKSHS